MYQSFGSVDFHVKYHVAELLSEAEHERLVALATRTGLGRSLRGRVADVLVTLAGWIDESPAQSGATLKTTLVGRSS